MPNKNKKNQEAKKKTDINKAEVTPEKAQELAKVKLAASKRKPAKPKKHQPGAQKIAKAVKKGHYLRRRAARVHTTVHFHRPKTLHLARKPQYARRSVPVQHKLDHFRVIKHPVTTESAMKKIEDTNTLVFLVDIKANKPQIKAAVTELYKIKVVKVNTLIRPDGQKKAYVHLHPDCDALEVGHKIDY